MKSILITGGTGSFGTAFAKKLLKENEYERICLYARGEHKMAEVCKDLNDPRIRPFIGDVRDRWRLTRACDGNHVVVHAAALKRIEVGHYNPVEMVRTNIEGAINVTEAARDAGVEKVVGLSTDKAFQPVSPYGQSKALAERILLAADGRTKFAVTRYGNVWGSAGSVVPLWKSMLASGCRALPVTDPDCTRFFMLMWEAVDLVERAINTMTGGELFIPELPAYRLGDIVTALGAEQKVIGLPEWEKKHESMCEGRCSKDARLMSADELRTHL